MKNTHLTACLIAWMLAVDDGIAGNSGVLFRLSCAALVSELPWLLGDFADELLMPSVRQTMVRTGFIDLLDDGNWERSQQRFTDLHTVGSVVRRISAVGSPAQLASAISSPSVSAGDLLWQGDAGFCLALERCERVKKARCQVLKLARPDDEPVKFQGDLLVPVAALLEGGPLRGALTEREAMVFHEFLVWMRKQAREIR